MKLSPDDQAASGPGSKAVVIFVYGTMVVFLLIGVVGFRFPVSGEDASMRLFPRVQSDLTCLASLTEHQDWIAAYPVTYSNLAIWMIVLGALCGWIAVRDALHAKYASGRKIAVPELDKPFLAFAEMSAILLPISGFFLMVVRSWSFCKPISVTVSSSKLLVGLYANAIMGALAALAFAVWVGLVVFAIADFLRGRS